MLKYILVALIAFGFWAEFISPKEEKSIINLTENKRQSATVDVKQTAATATATATAKATNANANANTNLNANRGFQERKDSIEKMVNSDNWVFVHERLRMKDHQRDVPFYVDRKAIKDLPNGVKEFWFKEIWKPKDGLTSNLVVGVNQINCNAKTFRTMFSYYVTVIDATVKNQIDNNSGAVKSISVPQKIDILNLGINYEEEWRKRDFGKNYDAEWREIVQDVLKPRSYYLPLKYHEAICEGDFTMNRRAYDER